MKIIRPTPVTAARLVSTNAVEDDAVEWNAFDSYDSAALVINTTTHRVYRSLIAGNVGHDPAADDPAAPVYWQDLYATRPWRMFDDSIQAQSSNPGTLEVSIAPGTVCDSVALLNVDADTVRVTMTDPTAGVVFDQTYTMGVVDYASWFAYFFQPRRIRTELVVTGMPLYLDVTITITLDNGSDDAACGECIVGRSRDIGGTQYGARVGIRDYSVKTADEFGAYTVLERAYSKRGTFSFWFDNKQETSIVRLLTSLRSTPVVYIGADDRDATVIYGFFKDFEVAIPYASVSIGSIEVEGLT